jgi:hypothetical protein
LKIIIRFIAAILLISSSSELQSQVKGTLSAADLDKYKKQVTELVKYYEETLNFLGDPTSVMNEKEIIINASYLKMFANDKVQVEDDLDENRDVPLNKDVQAYLKDIGFFFRSAKFEFVVSDINHFVTDGNLNYFKVSMNRILDAITVTGDTVHSRKVRFIEVNLDTRANALKIASVYTTKLNEKEENKAWWNDLTNTWKEILGKNIFVFDSIEMADITFFTDSLIVVISNPESDQPYSDSALIYQTEMPEEMQNSFDTLITTDTIYMDSEPVHGRISGILKQQKIDISGISEIRNLGPLSELTELREILCSNTLITDLIPIRNLNHLEIFDCSQTPVDDISPLHYSVTIRELNCGYTLLSDLSPISGFVNLEILKCDGLKITDLEFIAKMTNLKMLDCSDTRIYDLSPVQNLNTLVSIDFSATGINNLDAVTGLTGLTYLNCENTTVAFLEPLADLSNLEILRISSTGVSSLQPLNDSLNLKKIYCDNTLIAKTEAIQYMRNHPSCLVIFESEDLISGWNELESAWKAIAKDYAEISETPAQEELHALLTITKMNISGNSEITTLNPLKWFFNLTTLYASSTKITDFTPLSQVIELEELDISDNAVENIDFLSNLSQLHSVNLQNTRVSSLKPLENKPGLKFIYADSSRVNDESAFDFREKNQDCIVVYKTRDLENWWKNLPIAWKEYFTELEGCDSPPTKEQLHEILYLDSLIIRNNSRISDLSPVTMIRGLRKLIIAGTSVNNLQPLTQLKELEELQCSQSPVGDLTMLSELKKLKVLSIENTPVEDIEPLAALSQLVSLNCSGTQIKSLNPLEGLFNLSEIKLNNTSIKSLKPLLELPRLKKLECFNTGVSPKNIEKFKEAKPKCEVVYY